VQQNILERYPSAPIHVYAIWTDKRFFDSRDQWDAAGLVDRRVTHLWDGDDVTGDWLVDHDPGFGGHDWDAYALFGPPAVWTASSPPRPASSGSSVIGSSDALAAAIVPLLNPGAAAAPRSTMRG
jgi:hypothetical protein